MCAIYGLIARNSLSLKDAIHDMGRLLKHRGPDGCGTFVDEDLSLALGHSRLSIIDLSTFGSQPMISDDGNLVLVFNGEIYNYLVIKQKINAFCNVSWNGNSDTEVLLKSIQHFGLDQTLQSISGMFAFALYDKSKATLTFARDRIGEKPLYYGWLDGNFIFASELKALKAITKKLPTLSQEAIYQFFRYGYIAAPLSIFENIYKLEQGTYLTIDIRSHQKTSNIQPQSYWKLSNYKEGALSFSSLQHAEDSLESLLFEVIGQTSITDVPIGAFLSGGVDSSLVTAILAKIIKGKLNTFSIGFENKAFDEAVYAKEVAKFIGTTHHELYVKDTDVKDVVMDIPNVYDEPFADFSQIPTILLCKLAKSQVTVALSGDGADEIFGGYQRYIIMKKLLMLQKSCPAPLFNAIHYLLRQIKARSGLNIKAVDRLLQVKNLYDLGPLSFYDELVSIWKEKIFHFDAQKVLRSHSECDIISLVSKMMYHDTMTYLPDDIMVKVDRASMHYALETRAPFLDNRIVEFGVQLDACMKIKGCNGKNILKNILYKHVPKSLVQRPKQGFSPPLALWLRGVLKDVMDECVASASTRGMLDSNLLKSTWEDHASGKMDYHFRMWTVLVFELWYKKMIEV